MSPVSAQDTDQDHELAAASQKRVSEFSGNCLFVRFPTQKKGQLEQFGGTIKCERGGVQSRGCWIFASRKDAQFAMKSIQSAVQDPDIHVEEYSPAAGDACFTRMRVSGIPASGSIADVAKLTPKASSITMRPATCSSDGEKVAIVSFSDDEAGKKTFLATEGAKIQGQKVCVSFERKRSEKATMKKKSGSAGPKGGVDRQQNKKRRGQES